jgi:hypothetical protein
MVKLIEAIWLAAGAAGLVGTAWLMVASKLGLRPFRPEPKTIRFGVYPASGQDPDLITGFVSDGQFWITTPAGTVTGRGTVQDAARMRKILEEM